MHKLNSYKNLKFIAIVFQRIQHIVYCKYLHAFYILWYGSFVGHTTRTSCASKREYLELLLVNHNQSRYEYSWIEQLLT